MTAYYNEIDPYAAQWLRNLIKAGHIAPGDVDERSIVDVRPDDLRGYKQCHFFAGIGGWSIALRLAGWPDDRPVWTGSCPCQPFSAAGAGKAADDERHLWPTWFPLIAECCPPVVFGEQVEAAVGWGWLDVVFSDLETEGYACGAAVLPACGVGGPHIRQRLWFVADRDGKREYRGSEQEGRTPGQDEGEMEGHQRERLRALDGRNCADGSMAHTDGGYAGAARIQRSGQHGQRAENGGIGGLALPGSAEWRARGARRPRADQGGPHTQSSGSGDACGVVNATGEQMGLSGRARLAGATAGFWADADWIDCTDGKRRPVGPGSFPLGHGIQRRTSKLRAYGNAIVPQVAAEFILAAAP